MARARVDDELETTVDGGSGIAGGESGPGPAGTGHSMAAADCGAMALHLLVEPDGLFVVPRQVDRTHYGECCRRRERLQ